MEVVGEVCKEKGRGEIGINMITLVPENPKVTVRDEEMMRLFCQGLTMADVARVTGWSYATIMKACRREVFMMKLKEFNQEVWSRIDEELKANRYDVVKRLEEAAAEALEEMQRLAVGGNSEMVRLKASQDLMDRDVRISRTKRVEGSGQSPQINIQVLQAAAQAMKEEQRYLEGQKRLIEMAPEGKVS